MARGLKSLRPRPGGDRDTFLGRCFRAGARLLCERGAEPAKTSQGSGHSLLQDAAGVIGESGEIIRNERYDFLWRSARLQHADHRHAAGRARCLPLPQYRTAGRQEFR